MKFPRFKPHLNDQKNAVELILSKVTRTPDSGVLNLTQNLPNSEFSFLSLKIRSFQVRTTKTMVAESAMQTFSKKVQKSSEIHSVRAASKIFQRIESFQ